MTFELSVQLNCNGTGTQNNRLRKLGSADVLGDANGNGSTNAQQDANNTNPASADYDRDGLSNNTEWFVTGTDARNPDTDGDGISDSVEVAKGTDPLNNQNYPGDGDKNCFVLLRNAWWVTRTTLTHPPLSLT